MPTTLQSASELSRTCEFFTDADFARHLDAVSRLNAEAGQHEVSAASKAYGRSIVVHQNREDAAPVIFHRGSDMHPPLQLA